MKTNNPLIALIISIIIPLIVLTRFSHDEYLGPVWGLLIALLLPLLYGLHELMFNKRKSLMSLIGIISVLLTGVIGIMKFPPHWVAVKEAAIPLAVGLIVLFSTKSSWQLITKLLYNREIFDIDKIQYKLETDGLHNRLKRKLEKANLFLSCSFFFSAVLNFFLAKVIVQSMPGTTEFNEEIGRMTILSFPVIVLPSVVIMLFIFRYIMTSIKSMTQLNSNEVLSEKFKTK
jgi:hypothetical protein